MTPPGMASFDWSANALVALSRDSLHALRAAMYRDLGVNAAGLLQESGYAGGPALYEAFTAWLAAHGYPTPDQVAASHFAERVTEFFRDTGWGSLELTSVGTVVALDSHDWVEADPASPLEFPGCYYSSGVLADFFGRLAG